MHGDAAAAPGLTGEPDFMSNHPQSAPPWHNLSIAALVRRLGASHAARPALIDAHRAVDYRQLDRRTDQLARALIATGVRPGDRIALLTTNGVPMLELYLAAAKARAIALALNWRLAPLELAYIVDNAAPRLLFFSEDLSDLAARIPVAIERVAIATDPADCDFERLLRDADDGLALPPVDPLDAWLMLYTSGTTGRPKGCVLNQLGQFVGAQSLRSAWQAGPEERLGLSLPLFHVGGLGILLAHLLAGATIRLAPRNFSADDALEFLARHRCTAATVAPQLYEAMKAQLLATPMPLQLRHFSMGGGMHDPRFVEEMERVFAARAVLGYGQTEAGGFIATLTAAEQLQRPRACGRVLPHLDFRIVDEAGRVLAVDAIGELCVRGASTMTHYWGLDEATADTVGDGWLRTGDMFRVDDEGYLYMVDRRKELIKSGGENVYPREVEVALLEHPAIVDCSVFGVPHEHWGEAVKAAVVLRPGHAATPAQLADWCRQRIAGYKRPRFVEFLERIPRAEDSGKVLKQALQQRPLLPEQAADQ